MDDETGLQPRLVGFDLKEPTSRNKGKPEAIATLRHTFPYETIVMVGDGITGPPYASLLHAPWCSSKILCTACNAACARATWI